MRRFLICCTISALCLSAQDKKLRPFDATSGVGNILYPGTGRPPVQHQPARPIFQRQIGVRGVAPMVSARPRVLVLPYYFPMPFYGFSPSYYEPPAYEQQPQQPREQAPVVIINQNFAPEVARPSMREYSAGSLPAQVQPEPEVRAETKSVDDERPTVYLIAMKDSTIYSSLAYWLEDDTVHYITTQHSHNRATIDLIDRELSIQLNRERGVEFKLPSR